LRDALVICLRSLVGRSLLLRDRKSSFRLYFLALFGVWQIGVDWWWKPQNKCLNKRFFGVYLGSIVEENVRCCCRGFGRFFWFLEGFWCE
jgi:glucose dehydrogenase